MHEGHRQRMRERILYSFDGLSEHEILESLLFYCMPRKNTNEIAHQLLSVFGSLSNVLSASAEALKQVDGIGDAGACFLKLLGGTVKFLKEKKVQLPTVMTFKDFKQYSFARFDGLNEEQLLIIMLDKKYKIITTKTLTSSNKSYVDINLSELSTVFALLKPYAVMLAHNHLSDDESPTKEDDDATGKLAILLNINNIQLFDHLIVAGKSCYSYFRSGRLDEIIKKYNLENLTQKLVIGGNKSE